MELTATDVEDKCASEESFALYLYTPFCGTCQVGERMLAVIEQIWPSIPLYQSNINYLPELVERWQITSVPCLIVLHRGHPTRKEYAMRSVHALHTLLKPLHDTVGKGEFAMGECKLDHSLEDVRKKLAEQSNFLPSELAQQVDQFLHEQLHQELLNEIFHLLKKYDLASQSEREQRELKLKQVVAEGRYEK